MAGSRKASNKRTESFDDVMETVSASEELDFVEFLDDIGPSISFIDIFKFQRDGSRPQCERVSMDALREDPYEYLRTTWGPGKYWLQFKGSDRTIRKAKTLDVVARADPPAAAANGHGAAADILQQHLQFMQQQNAKQETMLLALVNGLAGRPAQPSADPAAMLTAVVGAFAALKEASGDGDIVKRLKPVLELAKELQPGGDNGDSWAGVARDVGRGLLDVMNARPSAPAVVEQPRIEPPHQVALPRAEESMERTQQDWLRVALEYLKQKATLGKPPINYVDWVLDNLEEPPCAAIHSAIRQGATLEHVFAFDPEISQNAAYVRWFAGFYNEFKRALADEANPPVDSAGPAGDA